MSIDALLAAQKAEKAAQSKPKFLTKAQREAQAAEEKTHADKSRQLREQEAKRQRDALERKIQEERYGSGGGYGRGGDYHGRGGQDPRDNRDKDRNGYQQHRGGPGGDRDRHLNYGGTRDSRDGPPTGPRGMQRDGRDDARGPPPPSRDQYNRGPVPGAHNGGDRREQGRPRNGPSSSSAAAGAPGNGQAPSHGDDQLAALPVYDPAALKARYLGDKAGQKKRIRKQSDKKFIFDWDKGEDTATLNEVDPLYIALRAGGGHSQQHNGSNGGSGSGARYNGSSYTNGNATPNSGIAEDGLDDEPLAGPSIRTKGVVKSLIDERHWSEKTLAEMKDRDWRIFREDFSIAARGGQIPLPLRYWKEANIPSQIQEIIDDVGYAEPSAIQRQAIPIGLNIRDMIGIAETGSGKTAAFVIPMLTYISKLPPLTDANRQSGPYALILAPTRELAQQIEGETRKFTSRLGYKCVSIVGGRSIDEQALNLRDGAEIVIATPGRLKDCIEKSVVVFSQCTYVVMDEADRMISLGFEDVINFILDTLPVSNLKPDTEEAEDASKMLATLIGGDEGHPLAEVYAYRQTVSILAGFSDEVVS